MYQLADVRRLDGKSICEKIILITSNQDIGGRCRMTRGKVGLGIKSPVGLWDNKHGLVCLSVRPFFEVEATAARQASLL